MKYRKKPVVIDAVQWDGNKLSEVTEWTSEALNKHMKNEGAMIRYGHEVHINTMEGIMIASPGDFIIQGVKGEIYPCKPDIFALTYVPAYHEPQSPPKAPGMPKERG